MRNLSEEVVLVERTTLEKFREWEIAQLGGIENITQGVLERLKSPEVRFSDLLKEMLPTDELWLCRSRIFEPMALLGDEGVALVRDGRPIRYQVVFNY